jgi:hypothetical protein
MAIRFQAECFVNQVFHLKADRHANNDTDNDANNKDEHKTSQGETDGKCNCSFDQ